MIDLNNIPLTPNILLGEDINLEYWKQDHVTRYANAYDFNYWNTRINILNNIGNHKSN